MEENEIYDKLTTLIDVVGVDLVEKSLIKYKNSLLGGGDCPPGTIKDPRTGACITDPGS